MLAVSKKLTSDPIYVLLRHDAWANRRLLEICLALNDGELDRDFGIGPGSIRATLLHIVTRYYFWTDTIGERRTRPRRVKLGASASIPDLLTALGPATDDLRAVAGMAVKDGLEANIRPSWSAAPLLTKGAALVHVCTHAMHHRAQLLIMLRRLGRSDVLAAADNIGTAEWQSEAEAGTLKAPKLPRPFRRES